MAIPVSIIRAAAQGSTTRRQSTRSIVEARASGYQTAFLCHSHKDNTLVEGIRTLLEESGWKIYVDWLDETMPETPNKETAARIKDRITAHSYFLFLATRNSMTSRWCPWEIGYADGVKTNDSILIIPTSGDDGISHGNEYLELYRRIDQVAHESVLGAWVPGDSSNGTYVRDL